MSALTKSAVHIGPRTNEGWQLTLGKISERLNFMLFNEEMADVIFLVGIKEEVVYGHKLLLSMASNVFEAMFYGKFSTPVSIKICDVELQAFRNFLTFVYTDEVNLDPDTVMGTLYAARKYAVPALEKLCIKFLEEILSAENAFLILSQAKFFDLPELVEKCLCIIDKQTIACINSDCFKDIDYETLEAILSRDTLHVREIVLYEAMKRWSELECFRQKLEISEEAQRKVLKKCIGLIRYPLMTKQEFASSPDRDGLLTADQKECINLHFMMNQQQDKFSVTRRRTIGQETPCNRFTTFKTRWTYNGTVDSIDFMVDRQVFISGLGIYGAIHSDVEYEADVRLVEAATNNLLTSKKAKFICDGTPTVYKIRFDEPVEIMPYSSYCASAKLIGTDSYHGLQGLRKMTVINAKNEVTFIFSNSEYSTNGTSVEHGQIPEILFYF